MDTDGCFLCNFISLLVIAGVVIVPAIVGIVIELFADRVRQGRNHSKAAYKRLEVAHRVH